MVARTQPHQRTLGTQIQTLRQYHPVRDLLQQHGYDDSDPEPIQGLSTPAALATARYSTTFAKELFNLAAVQKPLPEETRNRHPEEDNNRK